MHITFCSLFYLLVPGISPITSQKSPFLCTPVIFILPSPIFNTLFSFYLTCQNISLKLAFCLIYSLPLAFIRVMVPPVSLLLSLSGLVSLSVDIISVLGHRFLTLVSFRLSMNCILDLNQCSKFMSTWWVSDSLFHMSVPMHFSLSTCLLDIKTWVPAKFQKFSMSQRELSISPSPTLHFWMSPFCISVIAIVILPMTPTIFPGPNSRSHFYSSSCLSPHLQVKRRGRRQQVLLAISPHLHYYCSTLSFCHLFPNPLLLSLLSLWYSSMVYYLHGNWVFFLRMGQITYFACLRLSNDFHCIYIKPLKIYNKFLMWFYPWIIPYNIVLMPNMYSP